MSFFSHDDMPSDTESGYVSGDSRHEPLPEIFLSKPHLKYLNSQLSRLPPQDILRWCIMTLPSLYQETAFGLTGLVTIDILSKLSGPLKPQVELIFIDTLHHFKETLALVDRVREQYPHTNLHIYKPKGLENAEEFTSKYGEKLWEVNDERYDWLAKVEPSERAYRDLNVKAVLTGRRKAQGGARSNMDVIEVDDTGLIKVNPLVNWTFDQVENYVHENNVPYNALLDQGYKSVGDWHSTQPVAAGESERSGRWKGTEKTECGIHNPKSKYAQFLADQAALEAKTNGSAVGIEQRPVTA